MNKVLPKLALAASNKALSEIILSPETVDERLTGFAAPFDDLRPKLALMERAYNRLFASDGTPVAQSSDDARLAQIVNDMDALYKVIWRGACNLADLDDRSRVRRMQAMHTGVEKFLLYVHGDERSANALLRDGLAKALLGSRDTVAGLEEWFCADKTVWHEPFMRRTKWNAADPVNASKDFCWYADHVQWQVGL